MNLLMVLFKFIFRIVHHSLFVNLCAVCWRILPLFWAKSRKLHTRRKQRADNRLRLFLDARQMLRSAETLGVNLVHVFRA